MISTYAAITLEPALEGSRQRSVRFSCIECNPLREIHVPFMKEMLTILLSKGSKFRTQQNKLNGIEEIALSASISANDYIVLRTERLNLTLASKRSESRYYNLLDMHRKNCEISAKSTTDKSTLSQSRACRSCHR